MKTINDYVSDEEIFEMVESGMTYQEVADKIEKDFKIEFSSSTVGNHYRNFEVEEEKTFMEKLRDFFKI